MWTRACVLLTEAGHKVRHVGGTKYDVEGLAKSVGLDEIEELARTNLPNYPSVDNHHSSR
jgi:hypothetical protein